MDAFEELLDLSAPHDRSTAVLVRHRAALLRAAAELRELSSSIERGGSGMRVAA